MALSSADQDRLPAKTGASRESRSSREQVSRWARIAPRIVPTPAVAAHGVPAAGWRRRARIVCFTGGRDLVSQELLKKIRHDPTNLSTYLLDAQSAIEAIDKKAIGYDPVRVLEAAKDVYNQLLRNTSKYELKTGFEFFDEATGGIPRKGLFGTIPGKSHHGKSVWMDNLTPWSDRQEP